MWIWKITNLELQPHLPGANELNFTKLCLHLQELEDQISDLERDLQLAKVSGVSAPTVAAISASGDELEVGLFIFLFHFPFLVSL